jgi:hypothetical protein
VKRRLGHAGLACGPGFSSLSPGPAVSATTPSRQISAVASHCTWRSYGRHHCWWIRSILELIRFQICLHRYVSEIVLSLGRLKMDFSNKISAIKVGIKSGGEYASSEPGKKACNLTPSNNRQEITGQLKIIPVPLNL